MPTLREKSVSTMSITKTISPELQSVHLSESLHYKNGIGCNISTLSLIISGMIRCFITTSEKNAFKNRKLTGDMGE
jgi:hypothetical protein